MEEEQNGKKHVCSESLFYFYQLI